MEYILYNLNKENDSRLVLCVDGVSSEVVANEDGETGYALTVNVKQNSANIRAIKIEVVGEKCNKKLKHILNSKIVSLNGFEDSNSTVKVYKEFCVLLEEKEYDKLSLYYMQMGAIEESSYEEEFSSEEIERASELMDKIESIGLDKTDPVKFTVTNKDCNMAVKRGGGRKEPKRYSYYE